MLTFKVKIKILLENLFKNISFLSIFTLIYFTPYNQLMKYFAE